jgi:pyrimidine operon attenuation protein/uracil phosphoribosyltransferase
VSLPRRPPDAHLVERRELLDAAGIARALRRIAHEIVERNGGTEALVLVGVRTGGVPLAERIAREIGAAEHVTPPVGKVDITLYRDDVFIGLPKPEVGRTDIPGQSIADKKVILVDDVLFTGRTIRAALDALMDFGRPRAVELAVLVDRGLRELPIHADYVGLKLQTDRSESVRVNLAETDGQDRAVLRAREESK